ncbi:MAG: DUF1800 family protein [Candidatus Marinimicrobia bacterium]|nr:DUF1800 family protein [Candidatus Neomarinimicrobiota bacterium]
MLKIIILSISILSISIGNEFNSEKFQQNFEKLIEFSKNTKPINMDLFSKLPTEPLPIIRQSTINKKIKTVINHQINTRTVEFNHLNASHLLNRTMFGATYEEITHANTLGLSSTLEELLSSSESPTPPGDWVNHPIPSNLDEFSFEQIDSLLQSYARQFGDMRSWWIDLILEPGISIQEMMVLFWHDHFATSQDKIEFPPAMYNQNMLIREYALGNIKQLVKEMALDPAMILWLDNNQNKVRSTYVTGSFNDWEDYGNQLNNDNDNGVFTTTISLPPGYYQYKYNCGGWQIHDNAPNGCTENEEYNTRSFVVNYENTALDEHSWNECSDNEFNTTSQFTFNIDMSGVDLQGGSVFITGNIDDWSGMGVELQHIGNNIYSGNIDLPFGHYEYVVTVTGEFDDWSGWGMVDRPELGSNCDFNPTDQWANFGFALANGQPLTINNIWGQCQYNNSDNLYDVTFNLTDPPCPDGINENFARELLELFTIGIGNYTQVDIIEAARAYSGYVTDGTNVYFNPNHHDNNDKTFMGQTGNWNGDDIVDIIFEQEETALFFARKIYKWFLYEYPDEQIINDMANILIENNFEIKPMLEALFTSDHFYEDTFKGAEIKSTLWHTIGSVRKLYITNFQPIEDETTKHLILIYFQHLLGQVMFLPPDVSGWPGYRTWINTYTLPWRKSFTGALVDGNIYNFDIGMQMDALGFIQHFPEPNNAELLVEDIYTYLLAMEPTEQVKDLLLQELLQGLQPYNWNMNIPEAESRIRSLVKLTMKLSDYQIQ